jgi:hypothetical protein
MLIPDYGYMFGWKVDIAVLALFYLGRMQFMQRNFYPVPGGAFTGDVEKTVDRQYACLMWCNTLVLLAKVTCLQKP